MTQSDHRKVGDMAFDYVRIQATLKYDAIALKKAEESYEVRLVLRVPTREGAETMSLSFDAGKCTSGDMHELMAALKKEKTVELVLSTRRGLVLEFLRVERVDYRVTGGSV